MSTHCLTPSTDPHGLQVHSRPLPWPHRPYVTCACLPFQPHLLSGGLPTPESCITPAPLDLQVLERPLLSHLCFFTRAVPFAWNRFLAYLTWPVSFGPLLDVTSFRKPSLISQPLVWVVCLPLSLRNNQDFLLFRLPQPYVAMASLLA